MLQIWSFKYKRERERERERDCNEDLIPRFFLFLRDRIHKYLHGFSYALLVAWSEIDYLFH